MAERKDHAHIRNTPMPLFDSIEKIDWDDIGGAAALTEHLIRECAADKPLMRRLLIAAPNDPYLWAKCEQDIVEDKIVLWDDIDKGLRIRLRMSTASQERLAHCHRFSFTNLVLRGRYVHWHYESDGAYREDADLTNVRTVCLHEDQAGDCFTIHHSALHSTPFTELGTVSLVLRGNPVKRRAPVMFKESRGRVEPLARPATASPVSEQEPAVAREGTMFWRVGEEDESSERRAERQMTHERFEQWMQQLEEWELI